MADGSGRSAVARVWRTFEAGCPTIAALQADQALVGCCPRCTRFGALDLTSWRTPHDRTQSLSVVQLQAACICGCRQITLQVWPVSPEGDGSVPQFYRWR